MKVAIIHEWFATPGGSERVVEQLLQLYPQADLFALVDFFSPADRHLIGYRRVRTSFIQKLPMARRHFRAYLALMPLAVEQFDLRGYDLILSSNHAVAKGIIRGPNQLHISYIHTPIRYAWDLQQQYLEESGLCRGVRSCIARGVLHYLRNWDRMAADRVDRMIANSRFISQRIWSAYRQEATVIHPPVDIDAFPMRERKENFYVAASRLVAYKRIRLIVEAFSRMPDRRLIVIGEGPQYRRIRSIATPNVQVLGYQPIHVLSDYLQRAKALVFAAEEDFGILPVEAMACGTPVIAYGSGGILDTVIPYKTGLFFESQTVDAIISAVEGADRELGSFSARDIRARAEEFSPQRFRQEFSAVVRAEAEQWNRHRLPSRQPPARPVNGHASSSLADTFALAK